MLAEAIGSKGVAQMHVAETEKYAHVTFFFNGGQEKQFDLEERTMVPSPKEVPTYDLKPEMNCAGVADEVIKGQLTNIWRNFRRNALIDIRLQVCCYLQKKYMHCSTFCWVSSIRFT